jgi:hypothetical protein
MVVGVASPHEELGEMRMRDTVDLIVDDAFKRVVRFFLLVLLVWTGAVTVGAGYIGWTLGWMDGRQAGAEVACTPITNELVKPGIKAVP